MRPEVDRCVECDRVLEADERFRWVPPLGGVLCERCPGPPHERAGLSLEALKLLKAYQRLDVEALAALRVRPEVEREVESRRCARSSRTRSIARRDVPGVPRRGPGRRAGTGAGRRRRLVTTVQLHDIVSEDDVEAVMGLRRGPGQERYLGRMISHFEDAIDDARACPRMWSVHDGDQLVGFVMISDDIPAETLAADDDIVGPYFLWRLLIDAKFQGRGYGTATIDAVVDYLRGRPDAETLWVSAAPGEGSPQPFYLGYGFVKNGDVQSGGEELMSLDLAGRRAAGP